MDNPFVKFPYCRTYHYKRWWNNRSQDQKDCIVFLVIFSPAFIPLCATILVSILQGLR